MLRRGISLPFYIIVDLMMILVLFLIFFGAVRIITDDDIHLQEREVREIGLAYDAVAAAPGKVSWTHKLPAAFSIAVNEECRMQVKKEGEGSPALPASFQCVKLKEKTVTYEVKQKEDGKFVEVKN